MYCWGNGSCAEVSHCIKVSWHCLKASEELLSIKVPSGTPQSTDQNRAQKSIVDVKQQCIGFGVAQWGAPARSEIEMDLCKSRRYKRLSATEQLHS